MKSKLIQTIIMLSKYTAYFFVLQVLFFNLGLANSGSAQKPMSVREVQISFNSADLKVKDIFDQIEKKSNFRFTIDKNDLKSILDQDISLSEGDETISDILVRISEVSRVRFRQINNNITVSKLDDESQQDKIEVLLIEDIDVSGKVTDENGDGLPGASVLIKGTTTGTTTDLDGNFDLNVPEDAILVISFVGYVKNEVVVGNRNVINVKMTAESSQLSEVVVTAFGMEREKKALGYSAQELEGEDLSAAREVSVANFLTGKIAGVQVSKTAGGPTGSSSVTIRGNGSLNGNSQPLYVVDGVPIINEPKNASGGGGLWDGESDYGDGISDINPEDVLSMSVLKGPAAAALYGSRGANGVILITTKSGKTRKGIGVEFNSNTSVEVINQIPRYQNRYAVGWDDANFFGNIININGQNYETLEPSLGFSWGPELDGSITVADPFLLPGEAPRPLTLVPQPEDNVRGFYRNGVTAQNTVALSGGNEKVTGRVSLGNITYNGTVPNHLVKRNTASARFTAELSDFISVDAKVNYVHTKGNQRPALGYNVRNPTFTLTQMGRMVPMDFLEEYYQQTGEPGIWPGVWLNPYYVINELKNRDSRDRIIGYIATTLKFTDWLSLTGKLGLDFYTENRERDYPVGSQTWDYPNGGLTRDLRHNSELNASVLLTASKDIGSDISISGSVGANLLKQRGDRLYLNGIGLNSAGVYNIGNAQVIAPDQSLFQKEMQSVFFTGQVGYKNYLFLDVTGRNDWSSALGRNNISYFYPSVSTGFVFTDAFSIDSRVFTFGKIRASWAQVGNDSDPYLTKIGYEISTQGINGRGFVNTTGTVPLVDLKNELTESIEVGADLRFFDNRLTIDATYYDSRTTDQIIQANISSASGYERVVINAGRIDNKGVEAIITVTPIKTPNGFSWNTSFNYARNRNTIVELTEGIDSYQLNDLFMFPNNS
ncbi:MAG: SusC/RagA family TonB-linked outer membrane protein [Cyclobacteriaceae bacterium]